MAEKMSLKRKRSLKAQEEHMRAAKARRSTTPIDPPVGEPESCVSDSEALEESILMPAPDSVEDSYRSEEYVSEFLPADASELYKEWLSSVERNDVKMMAMMLYDRFLEHWHFTKTSAAAEVGEILGLNEKTVRSWRKDFYLNKGEFYEYLRGSYERL